MTFFVEGSIGDWGAIYLEDHWEVGSLLGITGYLVEKVSMICAGLVCDMISTSYLDRLSLLIIGIILSIVGFGIAAIAYSLEVSMWSYSIVIIGFGIVGIGTGFLNAIWYSMAGKGIDGFTESETSAYAMTIAMIMYLLCPVILGNISDWLGSLQYSFCFNIILLIIGIPCAYNLPFKYYMTNTVQRK
jgi:MFS family permease